MSTGGKFNYGLVRFFQVVWRHVCAASYSSETMTFRNTPFTHFNALQFMTKHASPDVIVEFEYILWDLKYVASGG